MSESEHATAVYRCLLAWTRSPALAEELTAETFYRAIVADQPGYPIDKRAVRVFAPRPNVQFEEHGNAVAVWHVDKLESLPLEHRGNRLALHPCGRVDDELDAD